MRFSASRMRVWMECPLQAYFQYDQRLPTRQNAKASFGVIIHHALEFYNKTADLNGALDVFRTNWKNPELLGVEPDIWPKQSSYAGLRDLGIEILKAFDAACRWENRRVLAVEHRFLVPFGRHELTGVVDLLEVRKNAKGHNILRIVDYKSGKKPYISELKLNIQFSVYLFASFQPEFWMGGGEDFPGMANGKALYQEMKDVPRRAIWFHLQTMKELDAGDRDDEDFMRLYRLANEIEKADAAGIHVPRLGEPCGLCSFTKECGVSIPERDPDDEYAWL